MLELYFWTTDNGRKALQAAEESDFRTSAGRSICRSARISSPIS